MYKPSPQVLRLFIFVGIVWAAVVGPGSVVLILTHKGATNPQIGIVTAIAAVLSMLFQPVWGMISDKTGSPRRVLCFCLIGSALFFGSVLFSTNIYIVAGLLLMDMVFRCGVVGLLDSHTFSEISVIPGLQYGHIRLAGSIFFGGLSLIYSGVIGSFGVMAIIPISVSIAAVAIVFGLFVAKGKGEDGEGVQRVKPNLKKDTVSLITNKRFLILILFTGLMGLGVQPLWVFLIEFVYEVGGHTGNVPLIHALRCLVEIPLFIFVGTKLRGTSSKRLMCIGAFFMFVYMVLMLFAGSVAGIAVAHMLGGTPGFIFLLNGRLRYLNEVTPENMRSTSITLMGTMEIAFGSIAGGLIGGFVLEAFGTQRLAVFSLVALGVAVGLLVFVKNKVSAKEF